MSRKVVIEFLGDSKDLQNAMGDADSKGSKLSGTLGKVGKAAALGLAAGAVAGGVALVKMTQGAIEDEAAQKKLATSLKNTTGATDGQVAAVEDWISAQGKALGVADDDLRPALQKLATATGDVSKAQKLASLAMDISAGTGKSLEQVTTALAKAQNGQIAGLTRLGIKTTDSAKDTAALQAANIALTKAQDDYSEAVNDFGPKSKEARDAAAALEYRQTKLGEAQQKTKTTTIDFAEAQDRLAKAYGGQAAQSAETLEGKIGRLKLILAETGETIGSKVIPIATNLADWFLNAGIPAVSKMAAFVADNSTEFKILGAVAAVLYGSLVAIGVASSIYATYAQLAAAAAKVYAATQWVLNAALSANPIGLVVIGLAALTAGLVIAWQKSETFREVVTGVLNKVKDIATSVANFFKTTLPTFFKDAWDKAESWTTGGIDAIKGLVAGIPGKITSALSSLKSTVGGLFSDALDAGRDKVVSIGQSIVDLVASIPNRFLNGLSNFKNAGRELMQGFVDGIKNAAGVIEGIASNVWNAVRGLLNSAIDKINAALEFTISLPGPDITINPPNIPHMAKGGIVNRPTLALIGEDGPEAVVPLSRKHNPGGVMPGGGGNIYIHVSGALDPDAVARQIDRILTQYRRSDSLQFLAGT